jgi:hypothetical protein
VLGALIGIALHHLIGSAQADPWGTLAVIVVVVSIGAYFITASYAAFVTCLVIALAPLYALTTPGGARYPARLPAGGEPPRGGGGPRHSPRRSGHGRPAPCRLTRTGSRPVPDRAGRRPPGAALGPSPTRERAARPPVRGRPSGTHHRPARTAIAWPPRRRHNGYAAHQDPHYDHRGPRPPGRWRYPLRQARSQFRQARPQSAFPVGRGRRRPRADAHRAPRPRQAPDLDPCREAEFSRPSPSARDKYRGDRDGGANAVFHGSPAAVRRSRRETARRPRPSSGALKP